MVLIGCGLSLEGVAGVDQEGPPGEEGAAAGFEDTIEFSNEGTRTSLGVQRSWRPIVMPLGFPCRRYHFNTWS